MLAQLAGDFNNKSVQTAWLNCDSTDKDPAIFAEDLLDALNYAHIRSEAGQQTARTHLEQHILSIDEELVIFIDEYELASSPAVNELISEIALILPAHVSFVLGSRGTPDIALTHLQLAGSLRIVDADSLRFNLTEIRALLQDCMRDEALQQVAARTEGWPFALQLVRLRAANGPLDDWVADALTLVPRKQIFDYLAMEFLSTIDQDTVDFLAEIAVLETVSVAAADAVRKRNDSVAFMQGLLVLRPVVVVNDADWSARLHPLLRDYFLEAMEVATPGRRNLLHARAASYLASQQNIYDAVAHAVISKQWDLAAQLIQDAGAILLLVNEGALRVRATLLQLPSSVIYRHPRIHLLDIVQQVILGLRDDAEFDTVEREILASGMPPDSAPRIDLELARCAILLVRSQTTLYLPPFPALSRAMTIVQGGAANDARALCMMLAMEILMLHRYGPVDRCERRTSEIERLYQDDELANTRPFVWMYKARNAYARGALDMTEEIIHNALQRETNFSRFTPHFLGQITAALLGNVYYQRGRLDEAFNQFNSIVLSESFSKIEVLIASKIDPAFCLAARGDPDQARKLLAAADRYAHSENFPHLSLIATAAQIEIEIRFGGVAVADELAGEIGLDAAWEAVQQPLLVPWAVVDAVGRAKYFLEVAHERAQNAIVIADKLMQLAEMTGYRLTQISAGVMRAHALQLLGAEKAASDEMLLALSSGHDCGAVQLFLDFGAEVVGLVRASGKEATGSAAVWSETIVAAWESAFRTRADATTGFTPRELDVLCELAKEQSNKMIAKSLTLAPDTVKKHLKVIFAKLNVGSREDAVAEARRRALMP